MAERNKILLKMTDTLKAGTKLARLQLPAPNFPWDYTFTKRLVIYIHHTRAELGSQQKGDVVHV